MIISTLFDLPHHGLALQQHQVENRYLRPSFTINGLKLETVRCVEEKPERRQLRQAAPQSSVLKESPQKDPF